jgi:lysophospholipase L1-like esterase
MPTTQCSLLLTAFLLALPLRAEPTKIACVGDSITQGAGLSNPALESYPARLQRLLGTNYVVRNYGVSGRTLLKQGDFPYWKEAFFKQSHDWQPDIVIIKLGTNDSKPYNWRYGTNFVADYEEFVASYASLASAPRIIVCAPCPVYGNGAFDIKPGTVATNITPAIRDLATRRQLDLVDFHTRLAGHPEWFPDTVHPNSRGMAALAAIIHDTLMEGPPNEPAPALNWDRVTPSRIVLRWPASWAGLVVQTTTALRDSNLVWTVVEAVPNNVGAELRQTNSSSGAPRFYRLWQP